jgi:hypothetical protein
MLDDAARAIEPEDVHRRVAEVVRARRDVRVRHHEITLGDRPFDVDVQFRKERLEGLDEGDERLGAVLRKRVVLRVGFEVSLMAALVEEPVERNQSIVIATRKLR